MKPSQRIFIDWYDGMVEGAIQSSDFGWHYLRLHWWSSDQDWRVYRATPLNEEVVEAFLAATSGCLSQNGPNLVIVQASEQIKRSVDVLLAEVLLVPSYKFLLADSQVTSGRWFDHWQVPRVGVDSTREDWFWQSQIIAFFGSAEHE